jgi:hypothetical protein
MHRADGRAAALAEHFPLRDPLRQPGCVIGDVIGAPIVFAAGWSLLDERLFAEYVVEFAIAYLFGTSALAVMILVPILFSILKERASRR